jgi:uncharacterized protein (TIGR02996 family)
MTERDALYRAIITAPDDDTPRLVFADYLDENGEPDRASFIRVQVELPDAKRMVSCPKCESMWVRQPMSSCPDLSRCSKCNYTHGPFWADVLQWSHDYKRLTERERDLFNAHGAKWFGANAVLEHPVGRLLEALEFFGQWRIVPARGFPAHWYGPWEQWVGGGECHRCDGIGGISRHEYDAASGDMERTGVDQCPAKCADGRIPGACETLAWRPTWEMECQGKASHVGGYWRCAECGEIWDWMSPLTGRVCEHRVPRPCPTGAVPLSTVTITGGYDDDDLIAHGASVLHGTPSKWEFKTWPGLTFFLPPQTIHDQRRLDELQWADPLR